jgi:hypothetical protein
MPHRASRPPISEPSQRGSPLGVGQDVGDGLGSGVGEPTGSRPWAVLLQLYSCRSTPNTRLRGMVRRAASVAPVRPSVPGRRPPGSARRPCASSARTPPPEFLVRPAAGWTAPPFRSMRATNAAIALGSKASLNCSGRVAPGLVAAALVLPQVADHLVHEQLVLAVNSVPKRSLRTWTISTKAAVLLLGGPGPCPTSVGPDTGSPSPGREHAEPSDVIDQPVVGQLHVVVEGQGARSRCRPSAW